MLRNVHIMSMSSDVLDTQMFNINGPVISLSSGIASLSNDTPSRPAPPCVVDNDDPDATPADVEPLAG